MTTFLQAMAMTAFILGSIYNKTHAAGMETVSDLPSPVLVGCVLADPTGGRVLETLDDIEIYTHDCSSGLYLVDKRTGLAGDLRKATPIVQGWLLQSLQLATMLDPDTLLLEASFVTGVGPKGARPFKAQIRVLRDNDTWVAQEPLLIKKSKRTFFRPRIIEVGNQDELNAFKPCRNGAYPADQVDFERERLILLPLHLNSGSINITNLAVSETEESYQLHYSVEYPGFVTKDVKDSLLWYVLPKNARRVEVHDSTRNPGTEPRDTYLSGVIDRCRLQPARDRESDSSPGRQ
jgi:hypothetical protein